MMVMEKRRSLVLIAGLVLILLLSSCGTTNAGDINNSKPGDG